ncbi:AMP-binding protein [Baekduia soli]|uniref:AMP-binding protein n=1 Tax=Baekduia soli TaxID=496014 RepID=UPI00225DEDA9|nr:class I adenylate-forming enzyme family protein [Baekduia soli]
MQRKAEETHDRGTDPPPRSLCALFQATVARHPDRPALRCAGGGGEHTWAQYGARVQRVAGGLAALGVGPGDTVALLLRNRPEFNVLDAAIMHLGAVPWSIYTTAAPEQIGDVVQRAGSRVAVAETDFAERVRRGVGPGVLDHLIDVEALDDALPGAPAGFDFEASWRAVGPGDLATIVWTSGTTGASKGAELTHGGVLALLRALTEVSRVPEGAARPPTCPPRTRPTASWATGGRCCSAPR